MKVPMTEVIAVRRLSWDGDAKREVLVSIGKPAESPSGKGEFYCPIQTTGLGDDQFVTAIFGVDAFQAIELALQFTGWRLAEINTRRGGHLRWLGDQLPKEWAQAEKAVNSAENLAKRMIGERLRSVQRLDYDWDLRFDAGSSHMFQSVWRLVSDAAIDVTSEDDGQQFGLKTPVDAALKLMTKISDESLSDVRIDAVTSDLTLYFGTSRRLEVVSTSSGYEAWSLHAKDVQIIGRNGDTVTFSSPK
jgi:hypothetical protein